MGCKPFVAVQVKWFACSSKNLLTQVLGVGYSTRVFISAGIYTAQ